MNKRDIELEDQCWEDLGEGEYYLNHEKFASLIRADEREGCALMADDAMFVELADKIRARGNT